MQAALLDDGSVMLTTHMRRDDSCVQVARAQQPQQGTFWDYEKAFLGQTCVAKATPEPIQTVHARMLRLPVNRWIGQGTTALDLHSILVPQIGPTRHGAFVHTTYQQYVTTVAPPLWAWADKRRLAGAWCSLSPPMLNTGRGTNQKMSRSPQAWSQSARWTMSTLWLSIEGQQGSSTSTSRRSSTLVPEVENKRKAITSHHR